MGLAKKLGLGVLNLAVIAVIAWFAWQAFEEYMNNPWTRDGQVRGQVIQVAPRVSGMVTHIPIIDNQVKFKLKNLDAVYFREAAMFIRIQLAY